MAFGRDRGIAQDAMLVGTGLRWVDLTDPDTEIRTHQELRLIENLARALPADPSPGLASGARYTIGVYGMLGFALMSSRTLSEALQVGLRFQDQALSLANVSVHENDSSVCIEIDATHLPTEIQRFVTDHEIGVLWNMFSALGGRAPHVLDAGLAYPVADTSPYAALLGAAPRLSMSRTWLRVPALDMNRPLPQADEGAARMCEKHCLTIQQRRRELAGMTGLVYERLARSAASTPPLPIVARDLNTTPRSLRRHLALEGTSYRDISERIRRQRVERLLVDEKLSIAAIAHRTGFATASALTHAFKRWHGMTPSTYRMQGGSPPGSCTDLNTC
jgi:AraC-like DNA-binding protein